MRINMILMYYSVAVIILGLLQGFPESGKPVSDTRKNL